MEGACLDVLTILRGLHDDAHLKDFIRKRDCKEKLVFIYKKLKRFKLFCSTFIGKFIDLTQMHIIKNKFENMIK